MMNMRLRLGLLLLPLLVVLGGCETAPRMESTPDIGFSHLPVISLDVAAIEVDMQYTPTFAPPNVDHLFPIPPRTVMERWAHDRLRAVGRAGRAVFVIGDASVVEGKLATKTGLEGLIRTEQSERYDATVKGRLDVYDGTGRRVAYAFAHATRFQTVLEDASLNERHRAWLDMLTGVMGDFNAEMERTIKSQLSAVVR